MVQGMDVFGFPLPSNPAPRPAEHGCGFKEAGVLTGDLIRAG